MKSFFSVVAITSLALLCGCGAGLPPQSPSRQPLVQVAAVDETGPFSATRDGRKLAVARSGLQLLDLDSTARQTLAQDSPTALSWSRDGATLAAAYTVAEYETRLELYSAQGELLHETLLPVALSALAWSARGDLLATGFALKNYSFGSDLHQALYRLAGAELEESVLSDTTLKPATARLLKSIMASVQPAAFSADGDELVYLHLHDPPQFPPYLELRYHSWPADRGRSLQQLPLQMLQLDWDVSGESVTLHSAQGALTIDLWPTPDAAESPSVIPNYRFADGRLFAGQELLADWGEGARLQILPDGRFLLAVRRRLYLGDGLRAEILARYSEKSWALRRWRFEELITPAEYQQLLRKDQP